MALFSTIQASKAKLGQPTRPCVVGSSWERRRPARGGGGLGHPVVSSGPASAVFLGIETPERPSGSSVSRRVTPSRKSACQMSLPALLENTHPEPVHVCTHMCTHTRINQSSVSIISLTSRQSCLIKAVPIA